MPQGRQKTDAHGEPLPLVSGLSELLGQDSQEASFLCDS